jgi:hypothetical protein
VPSMNRFLSRKQRELKKRIGQSMHAVDGYTTPRCRALQRKLARLQQVRRTIRNLRNS